MSGSGTDASNHRKWLLLSLAFFLPYLFATVWPSGASWGIHALGWFPWWVRALGLSACVALLLPIAHAPVARFLQSFWKQVLDRPVMIVVFALVMFIVFDSLPIRTNIYGDERTILFFDATHARL